MSKEGLDALRARVHADGELARRLRGVEPERFCGEVVRVAAELGCDVAADDLEAAAAAGRRDWLMRWMQ